MSHMNLSDFSLGTPCEVRWIDIISEPKWLKIEELQEPPIIKTIGYFITAKTYHMRECLIIAGSLGADHDISNVDIIPMSVIISLESLNGRP